MSIYNYVLEQLESITRQANELMGFIQGYEAQRKINIKNSFKVIDKHNKQNSSAIPINNYFGTRSTKSK